MHFPSKVQPVDSNSLGREPAWPPRYEPIKPAAKWRLRRLFERQFPIPSVLRISAVPEKQHVAAEDPTPASRCSREEVEPSSVCLAKMVQNFIEDSGERQPSSSAASVRCGRSRCNCFNGNGTGTGTDDSEDESDGAFGFGDSNLLSSGEACEILKSLVVCTSVAERNLLADAAKIVEKNKSCKHRDGSCRRIVTEGLVALGYDVSICKSRWNKSSSCPAGEYEYVDVMVEEKERLLVDVDFRSEFEIARPTKSYKAVLQILPQVFVGKADRLQKIVAVASEAAQQSMKKKGMPVPPWRKSDYVNAKWLSPYTRTADPTNKPGINVVSGAGDRAPALSRSSGEEKNSMLTSAIKQWKPPAVKPRSSPAGVKIVTGLAAVIGEKR